MYPGKNPPAPPFLAIFDSVILATCKHETPKESLVDPDTQPFNKISAKIELGEVTVALLGKHIRKRPLFAIRPPVAVCCKISISNPRDPVGTPGYQKFATTQSNSFVSWI